jgi:hypothetical protein
MMHLHRCKEGKGKEESSFCEQKEAKKLYPLAAGSLSQRVASDKSFFASFFSKKEDSSCHFLFPRPECSLENLTL